MQCYSWLASALTALILSVVYPLPAPDEKCSDPAEHSRLQKALFEACDRENPHDVYMAATAYQQHAIKENNLASYYNAWVCGINYALNHMNISDAYHITQTMRNDLLYGKGGQEEQFLVPNMLGQVYNNCGNISGAIAEFETAVAMIKGTKYEKRNLCTLYLGMAHIYINSKLEKSMYWIDEYLKEVGRYENLPRYYRNMANGYAFKAMLYFKLRQEDNFWECERLSRAYQKKNTLGSTGSFVPYLDVYQLAYEGKTDSAFAAAQRLPSHKDRYIVRCDILRYLGRYDEAFTAQRKLMHIRDSITGLMIADNIERMDEEIRLMKAEQASSQRANVILTIAFGLALLVIALLALGYFGRRRYQQRLLAKNRELEEANRQVTAADQMKTEFVRNVSHEIRTPLNIITGFTHVITDQQMTLDEQERQQIAATIEENTQHITSLVNKMLDITKEDTKDVLNGVTDVDVVKVCQSVIATMPKVDGNRVKVMLDNRISDGKTFIRTNGDSLKHMLDNLMENAAKFTDDGHIRLIVEINGAQCCFTIEDTGCGISEEDAKHIFERYMKVDEFQRGLGLGLAYCHETAEKLGGSLVLDQSYSDGCRFILSLPIKQLTS